MPDLGIGEAIGALVSGGSELLGGLGATAATAAPAVAGEGAIDAGIAGLPAAGGLGDIVAAGVPGALAPTAETGAGMSLADLTANTFAAPAIGSTGAIAGVDFGTSALPAGMGAGLPITSSIGDLGLSPSTTGAAFDPNFQSMSALSGQTPGASPQASPFAPGGVSAPAAPAGAGPVDAASAAALPTGSTPTAGTGTPFGSGTSFTPTAAPSATAPAGVAAPAAAPAATPNALEAFMHDPLGTLGSGAVKSLTSNPLGVLAGGAGLGYSVLEGQKATANMKALQSAAADQAASGKQLSSYITNGGLPPGLAAEVATATASAKASIVSGYASKGESTDPAQNSALAQDLAAVDERAAATQGQLATQLLSSGQTASNMSDQLYQTLVGIDQTQAANMGKAIANFASSLAGRTSIPGTSVTIGTGTA